VKQAAETGEFFRQYLETHKFDEVLIECSPFIRTMMTGAGIAKALGHKSIRINHHFCEWMSPMFFETNHLPDLMTRRTDLHRKEDLIERYLGGIDYIDESIGWEESLTYFPESKEACAERNRRLIDKVCA
jgi:broad specificity phosphatase PhoE